MLKRLLKSGAVQATGAWIVGHYLRWALATTRWRVVGEAHLDTVVANPPCIAAFWHERLPLMPAMWLHVRNDRRVGREMHVLVSRHRDGRFIADAISYLSIDVVHGSSAKPGKASATATKGGASGVRVMLDLLETGDFVAITPDGPRGPRRVAAAGVAQLGGLSGLPVLACAAQTTRHRVLGSWDRMMVPLPFGRGVIVCAPLIHVPREGWEDSLLAIQAALTAVSDEADRLCAG